MTDVDWGNLARQTLVTPSEAARHLLTLALSREALLLLLALVAVLNTMLTALTELMLPVPGASTVTAQPLLGNLLTSVAAMGLSIVTFLLVGRLLGGSARIGQIAILVLWLQLLQVGAQSAVVLVSAVLPFMFLPMTLAIVLFSLYITMHFLNEAHRFGSLGKSFVLIFLSGLVVAPLILYVFPNGVS